MNTISIDLGERSYDIEIAQDSLEHVGAALASLGDVSRVVLVTDENVEALYGEKLAERIVERGLDLDVVVIPPGEESKSIDLAYSLWERFLEVGLDRRSVAVAFGGGVVGDLTGFVAATYVRGIRYFQIPTTLLAQVDSSVGGKTAIDLPNGKNMVGAFYQPSGVLIDPLVLQTLSDEQYRSGLGEVVKYGTSLDEDFFMTLEKNVDPILQRSPDILCKIVERSCQIKARIVHEDERETSGARALLNYGHTFGHALETAIGYGVLPHGYGVALGSILAGKLSAFLASNGNERFQNVDQAWIDRQIRLLSLLGLPTSLSQLRDQHSDVDLSSERLVEFMKTDKKAAFGKLNFILPTSLGRCERVVCDEQDVLAVL